MTTIDVQPVSASPAAPVRETNVYASAALAFGMVGAVVLSVICAIAALVDSKKSDQGRAEAIAGLVMSASWAAVLFALAHWHVV
ncbi:hypothetical protein [Mycobacterium marinum]|uniref:hypothetical protein n=1 Tax=Mycobacterium marinum TaxID=1781 RepID=UPI0035675820